MSSDHNTTSINPTKEEEEQKAREYAIWSAKLKAELNAPPVYSDNNDDEYEIYDKYKKRRSISSMGVNDKFVIDWGTTPITLGADEDPNSDNFIYDKFGNRVTTAMIYNHVHLPKQSVAAVVKEEDVPLPKHT